MKKVTLLAVGSLMAVAAQAQSGFTVDPTTSLVLDKSPKTVEYIVLSDAAVAEFEKAGAKTAYYGPNEDDRNLWIWPDGQTLAAGDGSYPAVDMEEVNYPSFVVTDQGWSGAGYAIAAPGVSTQMFNDNTRFHLAYMTGTGNGPASIAIILCNGDLPGSAPAQFALGDPFNDNGVIYPSIAPKANDDWQGIDISFADLKKLSPAFNVVNSDAWIGNIMSFLGGGVQGTSFAFDVVYFYNTDEAGIADVMGDATDFVVTNNTINVNNGRGITLYNIAGQVVKSTEGCTLGISNVGTGLYIARSGNKCQKVVVR